MSVLNLLPDTLLYLLLLVLTDEIPKTALCVRKHFLHTLASCQPDQFTICKKDFIVCLVRFINNEGSREILRNILKCKSKLFTNFHLMSVPVCHTSILSPKLYLVKRYICTAYQLCAITGTHRIFRISK